MQPPHQHSRIDLSGLKAQIVKKLGPEGSKQYFHYLSRLLSLKISKVEFDKLCFRILGRENVPLHNQFIRSILRNACSTKVPPPINEGGIVKPGVAVGSKEPLDVVYDQNGVHVSSNQVSVQPGLSNGDVLTLSPRKARTGFRDRRAGDRCSVLGPNGKNNFAFQQETMVESSGFDKENGDLHPSNVNGGLHHHQGIMQQTDDERQNRKDKSRDNGKEMHARSQLQAPLGVPFCPVSVGGARRPVPLAADSRCVSSSAVLRQLKKVYKVALVKKSVYVFTLHNNPKFIKTFPLLTFKYKTISYFFRAIHRHHNSKPVDTNGFDRIILGF
ncbi:hypothetical protein BC332_16542 [Capsicum chinense]|nr:hypothetical protein BC332_16542 [Capsicum chinense]